MKQFKPKMSGGLISPEAHREWKDPSNKHNVDMGAKTVRGQKPTAKKVGVDSFEPMGGPKQASLKKHEGVVKTKFKDQDSFLTPMGSNAQAKFGQKTGPMTKAGKGKSGVTKSLAKANRKGVGGAGS